MRVGEAGGADGLSSDALTGHACPDDHVSRWTEQKRAAWGEFPYDCSDGIQRSLRLVLYLKYEVFALNASGETLEFGVYGYSIGPAGGPPP